MSDEGTNKQKAVNMRTGVRISVGLQIAAMFVILVAVNILGFNYYVRKDFSRSQKFTLSDQIHRALKQVKKPLKVIVYFSPTSVAPDKALYPDVKNFLEEVQFALRKNLTVEYVNPIYDLSRARELQAHYKFGASENVVILDYDGHAEFIPVSHMARWDQTPVMAGDPPRIDAFTGEQEFTTTLIGLLKPDDRKVYFLSGHGEPEIGTAPELSYFREAITRQSIKAESLNLAKSELPQDAGVLVIVGAHYDPSDAEIQILEQFWQKAGSLLVYLDPNATTPKLADFLKEHGIKPMDNRVLTTKRYSLSLVLVIRDVQAHFAAEAPATRRLEQLNVLFSGPTQSLDLDWGKAAEAKLSLRPLIMANDNYWGETLYVFDENKGAKYDEGVDAKGPVTIAASAEKGGVEDENVSLHSAKLIVVGNKDCLFNQALNEPNVDFFLNALNWMLDRSKLSGISPKNKNQFILALTDSQTGTIALYTLIVIPGIAALMGLIAWWRRRR